MLLHGITGQWQSYQTIMPGLIMRWHVFALDNRGCGKSGRVPGQYRFMDYARDVVAFMRARVPAPAFVYGQSLGAMVAIAVAAKVPERVRGLALGDPPLSTASPGGDESPHAKRFVPQRDIIRQTNDVDEIAARLAPLFPGDDSASHRSRAKRLSQLDPDVLTFAIEKRLAEGYDLDGFLRSIKCPVLVLQGNTALGGVLSDQEVEHAASLLSRCLVVKMSDCGHEIHRTKPTETVRIVADFLDSI